MPAADSPTKVRPELEDVPMPIETERLTLRPYTRDDAERLGVAVRESHEHLQPWMPWSRADQSTDDSLVVIAGMIASWAKRSDLPVGIFLSDTGELLGGAGLHRMNWSVRTFEIGYWIHPAHEGKGYVTETSAALTRYSFETLRAQRVEIRLDADNVRSKAIPKRLGFVHEGTLRQDERATSGELRNTDIFALIAADDRSAVNDALRPRT